MRPEIRSMIIFACHNVVKEPPFLRADLISARNLLIYLKGDLQKKLMPLFSYALNDNGILFLSPSETIGEFTDLYACINQKWKIYKSRPSSKTAGYVPPFPLQPALPQRGQARSGELPVTNVSTITNSILMSEYAPPYVVIDEADNILYVQGDTGKYLKLADGQATMNVIEMARRGLLSHLSLAIRSARRQRGEVRRERIRVESPDSHFVDLVVRTVPAQGEGADLMVIFKESPYKDEPPEVNKKGRRSRGKTSERDQYAQELELELKRSREDLQASIEELETSREELRSVNEELSQINTENMDRIEQLNRSRDDMRNLLNALDIASVFLDRDLNIKSFTPVASNFFSVRQADIGRPIGELSNLINHPSVVEDARGALEQNERVEKEVQGKNGRWYSMRIMPYQGQDNRIDGVLLAFFDIDEKRILQAALNYTQSIVDTVREPMLVLDNELRVISTNRSFCRVFRVSDEETVGQYVYDLGNRQWDIPGLRKLLDEIVPQNRQFSDYAVEFDFPLIGPRRMLLNARRLYDELGIGRILLAIDDVTGQSWTDHLFLKPRKKDNG